MNLIAEGKYGEALGVIREKVPFPGTLGRVCIHPCEANCRRNLLNDPIAIKSLKQFVADRDSGEWKKYSRKLPATGKKVAIVGSGPAGLTAAYYLAKAGHSVTVFEQFSQIGGNDEGGYPPLPPPRRSSRLRNSRDTESGRGYQAEFRASIPWMICSSRVMPLFSWPWAPMLAQSARIEGEKLPGVIDGVTVLRKVSLDEPINLGKKVAVIGGGNVAIDCARTALRLGANEVTIVYRRTRAEMPASPEEVEAALEEKINMQFLSAPIKISTGKNGRPVLTCQKNELGEPDESGRRRPVPIKGSEFDTEYDSIVAAIGQVSTCPKHLEWRQTGIQPLRPIRIPWRPPVKGCMPAAMPPSGLIR